MPRLPYSFEACPIDLLQGFAAYTVHALDCNCSVLHPAQPSRTAAFNGTERRTSQSNHHALESFGWSGIAQNPHIAIGSEMIPSKMKSHLNTYFRDISKTSNDYDLKGKPRADLQLANPLPFM